MKKGVKVILFIILFLIVGFIAVYFIYGCNVVNYRVDLSSVVLNSVFYSSSLEDYVYFQNDLIDTVFKVDGVFYFPSSYIESEGVIQFYSEDIKINLVLCDTDSLYSSTFKEYFYRS